MNPKAILNMILAKARMVRIIQIQDAQLQMAKKRLGAFHSTHEERRILLKFGKPLGRELKDVLVLFHYKTYVRWKRAAQGIKSHNKYKKRGRRLLAQEIADLIVRFAKENTWGYTRILSELKKLRILSVSRTTVKNVLKRNDIDPFPTRDKETWDDFIKRHAETAFATDFFEKKILT